MASGRGLPSAAVAILFAGFLSGCVGNPDYQLPNGGDRFEEDTVLGGGLAGGEVSDSEWEAVTARVASSVVLVEVVGCGFTATGTGFAVGDWIVTNRHVVEDAASIQIETATLEKIEIDEWFYSETDDLAFLKADFNGIQKLGLVDREAIPGDLLALVGHPLGGKTEVRRGRIFDTDEPENESSRTFVFQVTAEALPGDSGGPAVNPAGEVVGVTFAIDRVENLVLVIPASRLEVLSKDPSVLKKGETCEG